jgi:hypothetical protein
LQKNNGWLPFWPSKLQEQVTDHSRGTDHISIDPAKMIAEHNKISTSILGKKPNLCLLPPLSFPDCLPICRDGGGG